MTPVNPMDPDVDGDGVVDGADDQDHDDWTNVQERSRSDWPAESFAPLTGQPGLVNKFLAVNAYNPCLPNIESRSCTEHPPFDRRGRRSATARRPACSGLPALASLSTP